MKVLEAAKFAAFFNQAPVLDIPGRSHPVEIFYTGEPYPDYLNRVVEKVCSLHCSNSLGDILVFLPGQEDIEYAADAITWMIRDRPNSFVKELVLPLYSKLPAEQQHAIFDPAPPSTRKVCDRSLKVLLQFLTTFLTIQIILLIYIAETSLTIDGIVYVVDSGLVSKQSIQLRQMM